jgi:hypothetical protein
VAPDLSPTAPASGVAINSSMAPADCQAGQPPAPHRDRLPSWLRLLEARRVVVAVDLHKRKPHTSGRAGLLCQKSARSSATRDLAAHHGAAPDSAAGLRRCGATLSAARSGALAALGSHGRGHRFDTCRAHQDKRRFPACSNPLLSAHCQQEAQRRHVSPPTVATAQPRGSGLIEEESLFEGVPIHLREPLDEWLQETLPEENAREGRGGCRIGRRVAGQ